MLKEIAPTVTRVVAIFNPDTAPPVLLNLPIEAAGSSLGMTVSLVPVRDDSAIEEAIAAHASEPGGAIMSLPEPFSNTHRHAIIAAAARHKLPLIGPSVFPGDGGLMSYWFDAVELHAEAASYIDRILRGASPADLPVQQPTKYSLVINLKTAKALGLTVPPSMLDLADEVIE